VTFKLCELNWGSKHS